MAFHISHVGYVMPMLDGRTGGFVAILAISGITLTVRACPPRVCARMSIPKMSIPKMSTPKMSIPIMSTVPKCLFPLCLLCQNVYSQNVYFLKNTHKLIKKMVKKRKRNISTAENLKIKTTTEDR